MADGESRLLLIDGICALYRAFFGIRALATRAGVPTNAVFGFVRMLEQLRDRWQPTHWIVVFDGGSPERRTALLPAYKAQRPPMPDALRSQVALAQEYLECREVPWVRMVGQEADDVMASLAAQAAGDGCAVLVATSDKDLYQVVDERVRVVTLSGKTEGRMGPADVLARTGVHPSQVAEWLALTGDTVDNIPGVPGIGPKTAAELLAKFGSLARMWEQLDGVNRLKVREALAEHRQKVELNLDVVRLDLSLHCGVEWRSAKVGDGSRERLLGFLGRMEFESMAQKLREPGLLL
jgi:DNA polymerase-1